MREAQRISGFYGRAGLEHWRAMCNSPELRNILPNLPAALAEVAELVTLCAEQVCITEEYTPGMLSLTSELTDDEKSRMRFAKTWKVPGHLVSLGPRWGRGVSLALYLLPLTVRARVNAVFRHLKLFECRTSSALSTIFKKISSVAKKHGNLVFDGFWKFLVNWETLGGYSHSLPMENFLEDLTNWATGDVVHTALNDEGEWTEPEFLDLLEQGMSDFYTRAPSIVKANAEPLSIDDFSEKPHLWARTGSTQRKEAVWYVDAKGRPKKAKKTKWRTAMALTPGQVRSILREKAPGRLKQRNAAIQKLETGKVRAIVSSDDEMYLRMSYVSTWLEAALQRHPDSTLFMGTDQMISMWQRLARDCEDESVKIPLDQSHFDWQQNRRMISRFITATRDFIRVNANPEVCGDLLSVLDSIHTSLVEVVGDLEVRLEGRKLVLPVEKGVMSGWRWTALMDTVFNWGELWAARVIVQRQGLTEPVLSATAQGDDDRVLCPTYGHAAALSIAYEQMNFEVNPGKFFVDDRRDEYLRQVAVSGEVSGYLVRGINALLWRNPVKKDPPAGLLRVREQVKSWNLLLGRGSDRARTIRQMTIDLANGNGLSADQVNRLLLTPAPLGGIGMFDHRQGPWLQLSPGQVVQKARILEETVRGLDPELVRWRSLGADVDKSEAIQTLTSQLDLSEAKKEVIPGEVRDVGILSPFVWSAAPTSAGVPLQAYSSKAIEGVLSDHVLQKAIRMKKWDWIRDVWLDPQLREVSDQIEKNGRRRVWLDWITGKLPWNLSTVEGWSDLVPSQRFSAYCTAYWTRVVGMGAFNYLTVTRAALSADILMKDSLRFERTKLGG